MTNQPKKNQIIQVEPKPIETPQIPESAKTGPIKIGKVGTLNIFVEPLKQRYEKHYKKDKTHLLVDIILAAIVLVLLGVVLNLWIFSKAKINQMDFQVTSTPEQLINGQESEFTIDYTNISKDALTDVVLTLKLPASLRNPQYNINEFDTKTNVLALGNLAEKDSGQFKISGLLLGNFNEEHEFLAAITYKNRYGQTSQEFFSQKFILTDSVLKTEIKLPTKIVANGYFNANLNINNTSTIDFSQVKIKFSWPENSTIRKIDLDKISKDTYAFGNVKAGQADEYSLEGKVYGQKDENITFREEIKATYENKEYLLNVVESSAILGVSNLKLGFLHLENNRNIAPGGQTTYTVYYKNKESYALENMDLGLVLSGDYVDENYLAKHYDNANGNKVVFNRNDYPELAKIEAGQEGQIEIKVAARQTITFGAYQENGYKMEARVLATYDDPVLNSRISLESDPAYTQIDSLLSLKTTGIFYTPMGDQIGVGFVPPAVGQYTSYWVIIKANNTNNKIKDLKVTATVPSGIEFTNIYNVTAGDNINFNESTRKLEWHVSNINAFAGIFNPSPEARIQLAIIPNADQVGKSPFLLTDIKATATDEVTNAFVSASGKNVSIAIFDEQRLNKVSQ